MLSTGNLVTYVGEPGRHRAGVGVDRGNQTDRLTSDDDAEIECSLLVCVSGERETEHELRTDFRLNRSDHSRHV